MTKIVNVCYHTEKSVLRCLDVGKEKVAVVKTVVPYFDKKSKELKFKYYVKSIEPQVGAVLIPTFFIYPDQILEDVSHCFDDDLKPNEWWVHRGLESISTSV